MRNDIGPADGGCWPTPQQELLLRAALLRGENAILSWKHWVSEADIDHLDPGSYRLLPILYRNLRSLGVEHPLMTRLRGIYKMTWYKNQVLFHEMGRLLEDFHLAGIRTMLLKGSALTLLHYKDYGLRPMSDFDLLVPTEQASRAIKLLEELNWSRKERHRSPHSLGFENASGRELDLHRHVLAECCQLDADDDFWRCAVSTTISEVATLALNPTDQLLHVCVHGVAWNAVPPLRWVADAMTILKTAEVDWNQLIERARKRRLLLPLTRALGYLQDTLGAAIPSPVLQQMHNLPITRAERLYHKAKTCPEASRGPFLTLWTYYWEYLGSVAGAGLLRKLVGFPGFLQYRWGLDHLWQVPYYAILYAAIRARRGWRRMSGNS